MQHHASCQVMHEYLCVMHPFMHPHSTMRGRHDAMMQCNAMVHAWHASSHPCAPNCVAFGASVWEGEQTPKPWAALGAPRQGCTSTASQHSWCLAHRPWLTVATYAKHWLNPSDIQRCTTPHCAATTHAARPMVVMLVVVGSITRQAPA